MASNRIKGITIEIGGDTTGLDKALKGVNKSLSSTQASLRDVNKLLKLDPSNTTLLGQKQEYLSKAVKDTQEKLEAEKKALKQLKDGNETGEVTEQQKALEREILDTENQLKSLTKEYKEFGSVGSQQIQQVGEKIKGVGTSMTEVGKGLTTKVTVPIAAAGAGAVAAWKEVDEALDIVTKKTGATGDALDDMQTAAKNIATTLPTSFETAASAVGEVNTRFGVTGKELETLSSKFVKFAELNDTDVSDSVDNVQKALAAFGLGAEDAGDMLDTLNATAQATGIDIGKLTDSIVTNAVPMQELGFNASDAAKFLGDLEMSGTDTSAVLGGMRKAMQNATKAGKPMDAALKEVQDSIKGAGTETEAAQIAMQLFGNKAGPAIAKAVREGKISFEAMGTALTDYAGNIDETYEATLDPIDQLNVAMNQAKVIGTDIVNAAAPMITDAMEVLSDVVKTLSDAWNGLNDGQKEAAIKFALVAAAIGPVVTVAGSLVTGVGSIVTAFGKLSGAITAGGGLVASLSTLAGAAGPFLVGGAVVAGIVTATALIVKNWDKIKATAKKLGQEVGKAWNTLKTNTQKAWESIKKSVTTAATNAAADAKKKFTEIKDNVGKASEACLKSIKTKFGEGAEKAKDALESLKKGASEKLEAVKSFAAKFSWSISKPKLPDLGIKEHAKKAMDAVKTFVGKFSWPISKPKLPDMGIKEHAQKAMDAVKTFVGKFSWPISKPKLPDMGIKEHAQKAMDAVKSFVGKFSWPISKPKLPDMGIKSHAQKAMDAVKSFAGKYSWSISAPKLPSINVKGAVSDAMDAAKRWLSRFSWSIPKPSLPKITLKTSTVTVLGKSITYPSGFSVSWYRKAYANPIMFTNPTVLQTPAGMKGFGDGPGGEIVLSDKKLREIAGSGQTTYNINIYGAEGQSVNALADAVQARLAALQRQREAAGLA